MSVGKSLVISRRLRSTGTRASLMPGFNTGPSGSVGQPPAAAIGAIFLQSFAAALVPDVLRPHLVERFADLARREDALEKLVGALRVRSDATSSSTAS